MTLWGDIARTAEGLRSRSGHDAAAYAGFDRLVRSLGKFLADLAGATPPDIKGPSLGGALTGLKLGRSFRGLGKNDGRTVLRVLPMAVADFVAEAFETDALRAAIAARGIQYTAMGPWSAGTTAVLLADSAGNDGGAAGQTVFARGGPGALADALVGSLPRGGRCRSDRRRRRFHPRARRPRDRCRARRRRGDRRVRRRRRHRPEAAAHRAPRPGHARAIDGLAGRQHPDAGHGRQGQPRARRPAPKFTAAGDDGERLLRGRITIAPGIDALERAFDASKYGAMSEHPYLEATIPSLVDPSLVEGAELGKRKGPAARHERPRPVDAVPPS